MKQGALVNSLAVDDPGQIGLRCTEAELLGTIAERDSRPVLLPDAEPAVLRQWAAQMGVQPGELVFIVPLDGHPADRWLHGLPADLEPTPPTAVERWLERWPRASIAVVCAGLVLLCAVPGMGEPEIEADLARAAALAHAASEPR